MQKDDHTLAREYLEAGAPFRADSDFVDKDLVKKAGAKCLQSQCQNPARPGWGFFDLRARANKNSPTLHTSAVYRERRRPVRRV